MKTIFRNPATNRLRAGWRIILFIIILWPISAIALVIKPLFGEISRSEYMTFYGIVVIGIIAVAATIATWLSRKYIDKKSWKSLGLEWNHKSAKDLLFGYLLSGIMAAVFFFTLYFSGMLQIEAVAQPQNLESASNPFIGFMLSVTVGSVFILFLEHLFVGYWEELVFRGYLLQNMMEGMGKWVAIGVSCLLYGLVHTVNPNAGLLSTGIIVLFGFMRIYGYLSTHQLWLSMGMHMGWNFFQGPVFGFAASGNKLPSIFRIQLNGPDYLTGGEFGPESSLFIIPILFMAVWAMKKWSAFNYGKMALVTKMHR